MFIECPISFQTKSPSLLCAGKIVLLPVKANDGITWKVWVLSTWVEELVDNPGDKNLLSLPGPNVTDGAVVETDVVIIGAGTSGLMTAARLKALGTESVILERSVKIGDSWANRYDSLKFHVPTSNCEMPYKFFPKELQSPHRLSKDEVAEHLQQYAREFHLNVMTSTIIQSSCFDKKEKKWTLHIQVANNDVKTISCKHWFRLRVLTVAVVGSANTAFDVMRDCWEAGLKTTMIARLPTYIFPYEYVMDPHGVGAYDVMPLDAADRLLNTFPSTLDGQFSHGLFAHLASQEPDRYSALSKAGFPVLNSRNPSTNVIQNLFGRGGGHYIDVGGTDLIVEGKVDVRGMVEPTAYTEVGLRLSDGSHLEADAVIWCNGFSDRNVRATAREILDDPSYDSRLKDGVLGPQEIVEQLDASWGVDIEGEVRGVWKRHLLMENYWVIGGTIQHQRWWSLPMVQQIKLALEGNLPPAYRDTPTAA
ncbi:unnamed protein product [Periconia digitata]|uniref:Flavin-containing monooxygenase n=1 Tax=Periconia digitata TaxID=1303443 RepID=A0A9W4US55_9PLEO|nr:unnamed protein product [Periconia digitata]